MASSHTPSLTQDPDFASELLLNRIMNGQMVPDSGKTVTAANRALATNCDATGASYGVIAANTAAGMTIVQGTQDALTELVNQVKTLGEICSACETNSEAQRVAQQVKNTIDEILAANVNGVTVLGNTGTDVTIGESEKLTVGKANVNRSGSAFDALYSSLSSITPGNARNLCDAAAEELYGAIATQGAQYNILSNRYDMLNDLVGTYHQASDEAAKQARASAETLLSVVL
ncbi:MAG: hypothetical protein K6G15_11325 [Desulfovibrio sp.]|nr:hypothetical protein [Desulfovibrio sp.]